MVQPAMLRSGSAALQSSWSLRLAPDAAAATAISVPATINEVRKRMSGPPEWRKSNAAGPGPAAQPGPVLVATRLGKVQRGRGPHAAGAPPSKIRLIRPRHRGVLAAEIFMHVLAADQVRPSAHGRHICD